MNLIAERVAPRFVPELQPISPQRLAAWLLISPPDTSRLTLEGYAAERKLLEAKTQEMAERFDEFLTDWDPDLQARALQDPHAFRIVSERPIHLADVSSTARYSGFTAISAVATLGTGGSRRGIMLNATGERSALQLLASVPVQPRARLSENPKSLTHMQGRVAGTHVHNELVGLLLDELTTVTKGLPRRKQGQ